MADIVHISRYVFEGDADDLVQTFDEVEGRAAGVEGNLAKTGQSGSSAFKKIKEGAKAALKALGPVVAAAAAGALVVRKLSRAIVQNTADMNALAKRAKTLSIDLQELQRTQGLFDLMTEGTVGADRAIQDLQRALADARSGTGEAKDELDLLGLSADRLAGMLPTEQILTIARAMDDKMLDAADRTRVSMALLGRSGREAGALFNASAEEIGSALEQYSSAGLVTRELAAESERLQDELLLLGREWDTLRRERLAPIIPVATGVLNMLRQLLHEVRTSDSFKAFGDAIYDAMVRFAVPALALFFVKVKDVIDVLQPFIHIGMSAANVFRALHQAGKLDFAGAIQSMGRAKDQAKLAAEDLAGLTGEFASNRQEVVQWAADVSNALKRVQGAGSAPTPPTASSGGSGKAEGGSAPAGLPFDDLVAFIDKAEKQMAEFRERQAAAAQALKQQVAQTTVDVISGVLQATQQILGTISAEVNRRAEERIALAQDTTAEINRIEDAMARATDMRERAKLGAERRRLKMLNQTRKKEALKAWRQQKALAIAQASISTALAAIQAIATAPNIIVGLVLAGLATGAGIAAIASIAAQKPPQLHRGGMVSARDFTGVGTPDARPVSLRDEEGVLNPNAVRGLGGPAALDRLNATGELAGGGTATANFYINDRLVDRQHQRALRRSGSELSEAVAGARPGALAAEAA